MCWTNWRGPAWWAPLQPCGRADVTSDELRSSDQADVERADIAHGRQGCLGVTIKPVSPDLSFGPPAIMETCLVRALTAGYVESRWRRAAATRKAGCHG